MGELANAYEDAGRVNDAVALLKEALKLYKAKVGPENAQTLTVMDSLAYAYANAGHPDKEVALFEETLKLRQADVYKRQALRFGNAPGLLASRHKIIDNSNSVRVFRDFDKAAFG